MQSKQTVPESFLSRGLHGQPPRFWLEFAGMGTNVVKIVVNTKRFLKVHDQRDPIQDNLLLLPKDRLSTDILGIVRDSISTLLNRSITSSELFSVSVRVFLRSHLQDPRFRGNGQLPC